jgi:hypothetical protein
MIAALGDNTSLPCTTSSISAISIDDELLTSIRNSYLSDPWCAKLLSASSSLRNLTYKDGLSFIGDRLMIPAGNNVRECIFRLAHDSSGHFGFFKTYESIRNSFFWPGMYKDLEYGYIPSCTECMWNKSSTSKLTGPLHPLPVPDDCGDSIFIDFIGPLPMDNGFDCILMITDRLHSDVCIIPTQTTLTAEDCAILFFENWCCKNGLPLEMISDCNKLFISNFWKQLMLMTGIKHKCSSAYHSQSNGNSECTNKTVNQCLRFHVERNQSGWVKALPLVRF